MLRVGRVSVIGNNLYTSARYARWWQGGGVLQAEPGTQAKGHLAGGIFRIYNYQLATQVDRLQDSCFQPMYIYTCLLRATESTSSLSV